MILDVENIKTLFSEEELKYLKNTFNNLPNEFPQTNIPKVIFDGVRNNNRTVLKVIIPIKKVVLKTKCESDDFEFLVKHSYHKIARQIHRYQSYF